MYPRVWEVYPMVLRGVPQGPKTVSQGHISMCTPKDHWLLGTLLLSDIGVHFVDHVYTSVTLGLPFWYLSVHFWDPGVHFCKCNLVNTLWTLWYTSVTLGYTSGTLGLHFGVHFSEHCTLYSSFSLFIITIDTIELAFRDDNSLVIPVKNAMCFF